MTQNTGARWAPDPSGRHELRYWDGRNWTANVMDDYVPGQDVLPPAPPPGAAARPALKPLLPWWGHLMVGLATCGLWFVVAPAVHWFRRGAVKPALAWSAVWTVLIAAVALGGGSDDPVATVAATSSVPTTVTTTVTAPGSTTTTAAPPSPRALVAAVTSPAGTTVATEATGTTSTHRATTKAKRTTTSRTKAKHTTTTRARRTTTEPAEEDPAQEDPGTDPRFSSCKKAKAAGYGPYHAGRDVEYDWYTDADHDGVVCE